MSQIFSSGYACMIGVGGNLPNTIDDAVGLAQILRDPDRCSYSPDQVLLCTGEQADRAGILATLDRLAQIAQPNSTVIVYFSGHGYQVKSAIGTMYYLMPFGYDVQNLYETAISGAEFTAKLQAIPAQKLLLLLDCCHAGGLGDSRTLGYVAEKSPLPPEAQRLFAEGRGRVVIASSQANEVSLARKPYSVFTLALIEALAGRGVAQQDGYVRVADLALYAREVVPRRTKEHQHPILNFSEADNFEIAYYAGGDTEPKCLPFESEPEVEAEPGEFNHQRLSSQGREASGERSVVADHAPEATIVTGDQNVIQKGNSNIYVGRARDVQIQNSPTPDSP